MRVTPGLATAGVLTSMFTALKHSWLLLLWRPHSGRSVLIHKLLAGVWVNEIQCFEKSKGVWFQRNSLQWQMMAARLSTALTGQYMMCVCVELTCKDSKRLYVHVVGEPVFEVNHKKCTFIFKTRLALLRNRFKQLFKKVFSIISLCLNICKAKCNPNIPALLLSDLKRVYPFSVITSRLGSDFDSAVGEVVEDSVRNVLI